MENKSLNSILIGEEEKNNNDNTDDIFENIYNEMKQSLKALDEEEKKMKKEENSKEEKNKLDANENKDKTNSLKKDSDSLDFEIVEKPDMYDKNIEDEFENISDQNDF